MRLELAEFNDRVRSHRKVIISALGTLRSLKTIFSSGGRVWPADCEELLECLAQMRQSRKLHTFIERSDHLPLAVVPLRLPLIMALQDADVQITKLNRLLAVLHNDSWTSLDQSVDQIFEVKNEIDVLELKSEEVLDQIRLLFERARFKEREYSMV